MIPEEVVRLFLGKRSRIPLGSGPHFGFHGNRSPHGGIAAALFIGKKPPQGHICLAGTGPGYRGRKDRTPWHARLPAHVSLVAGRRGNPGSRAAKMMRHSDIRTTFNIYGDVVTDEMTTAGVRVAKLAFEGIGAQTEREES